MPAKKRNIEPTPPVVPEQVATPESNSTVPVPETTPVGNTMWEITLRRGVVRQGNFIVDTEVKKSFYVVKGKEQHSLENEMAGNMKRIVGELIKKYKEARGYA